MKALLAVVLSSITLLVSAQGFPGYVIDGSGQIVQTGSGLCLRNGSWTPANAVQGCDPVIIVKAVPVSLNSDVLFQFDSAMLSRTGRAVLDQVARHVGGVVVVEGHTDRIGTAAYNQKLSLARARAVANYLQERAPVKADYAVSGVGFSRPSGLTSQCRGPVSPALIECLAPDRRVLITIIK